MFTGSLLKMHDISQYKVELRVSACIVDAGLLKSQWEISSKYSGQHTEMYASLSLVHLLMFSSYDEKTTEV